MINIAKELTLKQEKFIQGLIKGLSQRESYKQSFKCENMTNKTIDEKASRLFSNSKIRARYTEIHSRLIKELENDCIVDAKKILKEISDIAFDDIKNYLSFCQDDKSKYGIKINIKDSEKINTKNISEISIGKDGFKFKLYCRDSALYKLAEIFKLKESELTTKEESEIKFEFKRS